MHVSGVDASSVVGAVRLSGCVVLHNGTFRAEHAQVVELGAYLHWSRRQRMAAARVAEQLRPLRALACPQGGSESSRSARCACHTKGSSAAGNARVPEPVAGLEVGDLPL